MKVKKARTLTQAGWRVGSTRDFLELSDAEETLVEMRLSLSSLLRERRQVTQLTQDGLARRVGSSQSRVARMEAGEAGVSFELLIKALLETGATRREVANALTRRSAWFK